jgi:hypothetical protein
MAPFLAVPHKNLRFLRLMRDQLPGVRFCGEPISRRAFVPSPHLNHQSVEQETLAVIPACFFRQKVEAMNVGASRNCFAKDGPIAAPDS